MSFVQLTRSLRRNQTPAEALLWKALRNRKLGGFKFLRQHALLYEGIPGIKIFFIARRKNLSWNLMAHHTMKNKSMT
jgi:hypothetical protein